MNLSKFLSCLFIIAALNTFLVASEERRILKPIAIRPEPVNQMPVAPWPPPNVMIGYGSISFPVSSQARFLSNDEEKANETVEYVNHRRICKYGRLYLYKLGLCLSALLKCLSCSGSTKKELINSYYL